MITLDPVADAEDYAALQDRCELCARPWTRSIADPRTHVTRFLCTCHFDQIAEEYRARRVARELREFATTLMMAQAGRVR
jgi:hypothetical protein